MKQLEHRSTMIGHEWQISSINFHPSGNMLASGSWDRTIRIWDVQTSKEVRKIDKGQHTAPITCVRWHPNGAIIASTSADNTTCLWDATTGGKLRTLREHFGWVLGCSFAPDRTKLATCSWDKTVRIWDPSTGELISTLRGHTKGVWQCQFYPVGHTSALLASVGEDATARLWDTRTRKVALTLSGGHADAVYSMAWSADGSYIATGSADRTVAIWDPKAAKILRLLKGHDDTVKGIKFTSTIDQQTLASVGGYATLMWNPKAATNNCIAISNTQHDAGKEVEDIDLSPNGKIIATAGRDGKICLAKVPKFAAEEFVEKTGWQAKKEQMQEQEWVAMSKTVDTGRSVVQDRKRWNRAHSDQATQKGPRDIVNQNSQIDPDQDKFNPVPMMLHIVRNEHPEGHAMVNKAQAAAAAASAEDAALVKTAPPPRRNIEDPSALMAHLRERNAPVESGLDFHEMAAQRKPAAYEPTQTEIMESLMVKNVGPLRDKKSRVTEPRRLSVDGEGSDYTASLPRSQSSTMRANSTLGRDRTAF